jgi:hypothetical protein
MRRKRCGIKATGTRFTSGVVFAPTWDDVNAVVATMYKLGLLKDLVPEINVTVILAHRGPMSRTVPLILERAYIRKYKEKAPENVLDLLWVIACFNYRFCKGPYPGSLPTRYRHPRRRAVLDFRCPFCGQEYAPHPRWKSRKAILTRYATWIRKHAVECDKLLYLDRSVR